MYGRRVCRLQQRRIFSIAITAVGDGEATASDFREHTVKSRRASTPATSARLASTLTAALCRGMAALSLVTPRPPPTPLIQVTSHSGLAPASAVPAVGWALDATAPVWGRDDSRVGGRAKRSDAILGVADTVQPTGRRGRARPQFVRPGSTYSQGLAGELEHLRLLVHHGARPIQRCLVPIVIDPSGIMSIDLLGSQRRSRGCSRSEDGRSSVATSGTGVDAIHGWAFRVGQAGTVFLGSAGFGNRLDVPRYTAAILNSGFKPVVNAGTLPAGIWDIMMFGHARPKALRLRADGMCD
jgi:hypothetical protein